ncbi:hypothetical protein HPB52_000512 [Rhipicephalus sanguineus]|uniref:Uncharacterized protein n=1 Tax=Rhipicephalus sanguineus TaxID=34632 RepID=A0A9D4Q3V8_RHISA|nr:hypothetical protein HPB52_000512 [Rhipicephalus sanguineus]
MFDATDDDANEEELEAVEEYDRKMSYAVSRARFFFRELATKTTALSTSRPEATLKKPKSVVAAPQRTTRVRFRVSALTGLTVSPGWYNVVLTRVLMKCLPDDLAILCHQKLNEAPQDTSGHAASACSRLTTEDALPPPSPVGRHLPTASALAVDSVAVTEEAQQHASSDIYPKRPRAELTQSFSRHLMDLLCTLKAALMNSNH